MNKDLTEIEALVRTYFDALYDGDADRLATIFLPTSALAQSVDGKPVVMSRDAWLDWVRTRPSGRKQGLERGDHVLAVDMIGPSMALAKVKCQLPPRYFTDLLSLLKVDGRWQVAQKVFQTEPKV